MHFYQYFNKLVSHELSWHKITDIDSKDAQDILKLGSELLETISRKLTDDRPGVGGWRRLASHLIADQHIDDPDIISKLEPPRQHEIHSPTKKVIEWLTANKPDVTIDELIAKCVEINRNDAVDILIIHYSRAVSKNLSMNDILVGQVDHRQPISCMLNCLQSFSVFL